MSRAAIRSGGFLLAGVLALAGLLSNASADTGPPAHLQIVEAEPGLFRLQWRVPQALPARAVPAPDLPESCEPTGEPDVLKEASAWRFSQQWRCRGTLAGQPVGLRYPFPNLALTTVLRVELLSGDRFAHILVVGEGTWTLPQGTAPPDRLRDGQRAVLAGAAHAGGEWIHLAFMLAIGLLGALGSSRTAPGAETFRMVTAFTLAQVLGAVLASLMLPVPGPPAEIAFGLAVALLAREALRPPGGRRRLLLLAGIAGLLHGLGIAALLGEAPAYPAAHPVLTLLAILGMDAAHLLGAGMVTVLATRVAGRKGIRPALAYAAGSVALAFSFGLALGGGAASPPIRVEPPVPEARPVAGSAPASRRVAPSADRSTVQSFLAVEPFEVRHEVMLHLHGLAGSAGLQAEGMVAPEDQPELLGRLTEQVRDATTLRVDGTPVPGLIRRADFLVVDASGALPRSTPAPEPVLEAVVGIVVAYGMPGMADSLELQWNAFPGGTASIPATWIDPEDVRTELLTPEEPSTRWENRLTEDPIPTVSAVQVEPTTLPVPWASLPLLALGFLAVVAGRRRQRKLLGAAAGRILLAMAVVAGPLASTAVALPGTGGGVPTERQARRVLAGLLPGIYRALEFREPERIYDRLAVAVAGDALNDIYLQQRRALELEERGGARARVETVEILEVGDLSAAGDGFRVRAAWTVGGMVTHFGHRHFRQNRYDANLVIGPDEGDWKVRSIDVLDQERIR